MRAITLTSSKDTHIAQFRQDRADKWTLWLIAPDGKMLRINGPLNVNEVLDGVKFYLEDKEIEVTYELI